jgi:ComF family protein
MKLVNTILDVMFPRYCLICDQIIYGQERFMCLICESGIPMGYYQLGSQNPVEKTFWGRCKVESASAYMRYRSDSKYSNLIKNIKYDDGIELAIDLGNLFGNWIKSDGLTDFDCLVPVPLHPKKMHRRGYNQSEEIAKGLSKSFGLPIINDLLLRDHFADSQTKKSRFYRWENTQGQYRFGNFNNGLKHLVLVDDVITTGATIESCIREIHKNIDVKISVLALGFTQ